MEISMEFLKKLEVELPYDPSIPLLSKYPQISKSSFYKNTCITMFIAALFTIVKLWSQSRCTSMDEWIKKIWYMSTIAFDSAINKNELMLFSGK
jgi:hypothetical protein